MLSLFILNDHSTVVYNDDDDIDIVIDIEVAKASVTTTIFTREVYEVSEFFLLVVGYLRQAMYWTLPAKRTHFFLTKHYVLPLVVDPRSVPATSESGLLLPLSKQPLQYRARFELLSALPEE